METPVRSEQRIYTCHCLLIYDDGHENPCHLEAGPDQPFCEQCDDRHPTTDSDVITVTTY